MRLVRGIEYYGGERPEMINFIPDSAKNILDIGCGQGKFGAQLLQPDREVWGVEPFSEAAIIASGLLNKVLVGRVEDVLEEIPEKYFDIIVLNDVIEHLFDPWKTIKDLKSKLKPDGKIIASIPNIRYIVILYELLVKKDLEYRESGIMDSTHLRFFTRKSMIRLFSSNGYKIEKVKGIHKTSSILGMILASLLYLLSLTYFRDIFYKEFVVTAFPVL